VISIGNLAMGGTGKTPATIALAKWLLDSGCRVAILSRGYKGKHRDGPLLVSDGQRICTTANEAGDEPMVIARNLPRALVAVSKQRAKAGAWLEERFRVDVHLLDDGFQHLQLHRDLNLLVIDATNPFAGGLPPRGRLREPLDAICRADAVLLTRTEVGQTYTELIGAIHRHKPGIPCLRVRQKLASLRRLGEDKELPVESLHSLPVMAFAGIGNPPQFLTALREAGIDVARSVFFPDHHGYRAQDYRRLAQECEKTEVNTLITTEKDAEKLSALQFGPRAVFAARVAFEFDDLPELSRLLSQLAGVGKR
jgi:tetraacyldisaccharide 4'-kinase